MEQSRGQVGGLSVEENQHVDIAIIGMGCRFPGAENYESYWKNLKKGDSSISEIPKERWEWQKYYDLPNTNKKVSKWGGFIENVDTFDMRFFGLSNREVDAMDPQQRIMLELTWSCFEDAGICPASVSGSNIGVFMAAFNFDFKELIERNQEDIQPHYATGLSAAIIPNRISYCFNLKGPSFEIDNACSGSLTAIHTACQSIINGECEMALAGGVSIILSPARQISFSQMGMMSPTGQCRTFDNSANGYVRGEGAGVVLLKPLSKALEDGDPIHGVIKGSAINHCGKTYTLTYPSPEAQAAVIEEAIKRADVTPESISYVEAHGTGTPKGDPIEFEGLVKAFHSFKANEAHKENEAKYCGISSAKTNIGHLEAAAGVAGVIKVLLSMKHKYLPKLLNYHELNSRISIEDSPFYIIKEGTNWECMTEGESIIPRRAGVSSFGFGGTNGHMILEEACESDKKIKHPDAYYIIMLSAKTQDALEEKVDELFNWINQNEKAEVADICTTLMIGREHFSKRIALLVESKQELRGKLKLIIEKQEVIEGVYKEDQREEIETVDFNNALKTVKSYHTLKYKKILIDLARAYVQGQALEWQDLIPNLGRRINLPTYPFRKEKCWMPKVKAVGKQIEEQVHSLIHPFISENVSWFGAQHFISYFDGTEEFLLKDSTGKYLPELACLEMVRVAMKLSLRKDCRGILIKDINWYEPIKVDETLEKVQTVLYPNNSSEIEWEIYSEKKNIENQNISCDGKAIKYYETKKLDLDKIRKQDASGEALIKLEKRYDSEKRYREELELDPEILRQCIVKINESMDEKLTQIKLVGLKSLSYTAGGEYQWAYIHFNKDGAKLILNIDLCDDMGNVGISIDSLECECRDAMMTNVEKNTPVYEAMEFEENWKEETLCQVPKDVKNIVAFLSDRDKQEELQSYITSISEQTQVVFVNLGKEYQENSKFKYSIRFGEKEDYIRCFKNIKEQIKHVDSIFYLYPTEEEYDVADPSDVIYMLQAVAKATLEVERILLVGSYKSDIQRCYIESWIGIERSIGLVMPKTKVNVICLETSEENIQPLPSIVWGELNNHKTESAKYDLIGRKVCVKKEVELMQQEQGAGLKEQGVYFITGGLGALGIILSQYLIENYEAKIILIGRHTEEEQKGKLEVFKEHLPSVMYAQADVCDVDEVKLAIKKGKNKFGHIDGVIHAAGIEGKGSLLEKEIACYKQVVAPKIQGTLALSEACKDEQLDFICYFSSCAAIIGDFGSCDYAVANRFLMSYGEYYEDLLHIKKSNTKVVVINWPLWKDGGMCVEDSMASEMYLRSSGQRFLEKQEGMRLFEDLLKQNGRQHMILIGERERVYRFLESKQTKQDDKKDKKSCHIGKGRKTHMQGWAVKECLLWELKTISSQILRISRESLEVDENLAEFGFDSVSLGELAEALSACYEIVMTPDIFFTYPSLERVAQYLLEHYAQEVNEFYQEEVIEETGRIVKEMPTQKKIRKLSFDKYDNLVVNSPISEKQKNDEIAIVGMSGRFPDARNIDELWNILADGKEVIHKMPKERREWCEENGNVGVMPGIAEFDPLFFEISPLEAENMDPRQRLLLQETWHALEDAGYNRKLLEDEKVGMFVGIEDGDYKNVAKEGGLTSNHNAILAARLGYFLNFSGPNMAINTACSSGLVAVHEAVLSLRNGECDTAIVAAANIMATPNGYKDMKKAGMLAKDGRCYAFDKRANGMVPAEAVGVIVLKKMTKAKQDHHSIYATIIGSGINYDGKTNGITAPNGGAQGKLLKDVYDHFNINPEEISYIVTHGTGTKLGDPVEISALTETFKAYTSKNTYCALTSTKPNIGHALAASGIVSLISLATAMNRGAIPPSINCEQPNDYIQWQNSPFYINRELKIWKDEEKRRIGAVSAFGMSGTNVHVVLRSYRENEVHSENNKPYTLLVLSAKNNEALQVKIEDLICVLKEGGETIDLTNMSYTLMLGRQQFEHRCAIVVKDVKEAIAILKQASSKEGIPNLFRAVVTRDFRRQVSIQKTIEELIAKNRVMNKLSEYKENLCALADFYCRGYEIPIEKLFSDCNLRRMHLPTYPFARNTYWAVQDHREARSNISYLHPLVHQNDSTLIQQGYKTLFTKEELLIANDSDNVTEVSYAAYIEMANFALKDALKDRLTDDEEILIRDIEWNQSLTEEQLPIKVKTELSIEEDLGVRFEIYSEVDKSERVIYCQGNSEIITKQERDNLDLGVLKNECTEKYLTHEMCINALLEENSLFNENVLNEVEELYIGEEMVLVKVGLSESMIEGSLTIHPALLEIALRLISYMSGKKIDKVTSLGQLTVHGMCDKEMWIAIKSKEQQVDVTVCDKNGQEYITLTDLSYKLDGEATSNKTLEEKVQIKIADKVDEILLPKWQKVQMEKEDLAQDNVIVIGNTKDIVTSMLNKLPKVQIWDIDYEEKDIQSLITYLGQQETINHLIWFVPNDDLQDVVGDQIIKQQEKGTLFLFRLIKALIALDYNHKKLKWSIITRASQKVLETDKVNPIHAGVHGLASVMAKEMCEWEVTVLDMADKEVADNIYCSKDEIEDNTVAYRNGSWYRREFVHEKLTTSIDHEKTYRKGGVYVVIGGAGGIGQVWSEYMIRTYQAKLIWIGRRKQTAEIEEKIERLSMIGPAPYYISADATDLKSMENAYKQIKQRYPYINGVVHSAIGALDKSLLKMDEELYRTIISIKVDASVYLAKVFGQEELDFVIYFSSIAALNRFAGQSGYVTGCVFEDAYAQCLAAAWKCKVKTINWGYWGTIGIGQAMPQSFKTKLALTGIDPVDPKEAMMGLDNFMDKKECQMSYRKETKYRSDEVEEQHIEQPKEKILDATLENQLLEKTTLYIKKLVGDTFKIPYKQLETNVELENYGIDSIIIEYLTYAFSKVFKSVNSTVFFECHTIDELISYVMKNERETLFELFNLVPAKEAKEIQKNEVEQPAHTKVMQQVKREYRKTWNNIEKQNISPKVVVKKEAECTHMPIAIIGMSGRFPEASNIDEFWENLKSGKDSVTEIPKERWSMDDFYVGDIKKAIEQKKSYCKWGGFIEGFADFDPLFFKISPREAMNMDPQERLMLQECWCAFEDAGYTKQRISQSCNGNVGVFIGITRTGFELYSPDLWKQGENVHLSTSFSSVANRISYLYNLHGPSLPIDTMCSSSLSAVHEACEHLRRGECKMAIAGGVNIYTHPSIYVLFCEKRMLSIDGRCKSFGKGANGFVPGEGVAAILLKPLDKAIEDGDHIYAVIQGTGINHGGKTNGYTVPNPNAQRDLIRHTLDKSNINARTVSYIEAHGTGTELGDPIEVAGLTEAFHKDTEDNQYCAIGSAKSNIGHLEGAAGIVGLIKCVLQIQNHQLVPSLHAKELNPKIDFAHSPFYVQRELTEWKRPLVKEDGTEKEYPRIAGVSAFGAGGANAHVIVEEYIEGNEQI